MDAASNLLLHGIRDADIRNDDTLANPLHVKGGELERFDRVITNPPFSQNYDRAGIPFPERFAYGWTPEGGKKADLMFLQHMLAVLSRDGIVVTVMPHGVLFRGGEEGKIRRRLIEEDVLDTVIGVGPNLFYGTGIPAAILILRAKGTKPADRRGRVLFINADAEYEEGRAQNLRPEHEERIVAAHRAFTDIPGFASIVTAQELAENDWNCNIRRYADNAPPPEPQDVRAHLHGGVPRAELDAHVPLFSAHGIDVYCLFAPRDEGYVDFTELGGSVTDVISERGSAREAAVATAFDDWWGHAAKQLLDIAGTGSLVGLRAGLVDTFADSLEPVGLLDRHELRGLAARWWDDVSFDLETLATRGAGGVIDGWLTTAGAAQDDGASLIEHPIIWALVPELLVEREELAARVAEIDATLKSAEASGGDDDANGDTGDEDLTPVELKALRARRTTAKKALRTLDARLLDAANEVHGHVEAGALTCGLLRIRLQDGFSRRVAANHQALVDRYQIWHGKYAVTLRDLEAERDAATGRLNSFLTELGYE